LWEGFVDHFVSLARLPDGFAFPPDLADRFWYDATKGRLFWRGFMSKATFDRLILLSPDWSYRVALEKLFQLCTPESEAPAQPKGLSAMFHFFVNRGPRPRVT
jgi:hypothetical protein